MVQATPKLKQALNSRANASTANSAAASSRSSKDSKKANTTSRLDMEKLSSADSIDEAEIKYLGDPENQVIVFDLDETLIAGDKHPINKKREKEINAIGDRKVETVPKDHPFNKQGREIKYVLRPGAKELLEYLYAKGHKIVACTRNYSDRAKAICDHDPVLSKYISGSVGRAELKSDLNKDFKKSPKHPDKIGFFAKLKHFVKNIFVGYPKFAWLKFKSIFTGANIRWTDELGSLGKYPPNIIELLKAGGNHEFDDCAPARFLVDNSDKRETRDCKKSGDWVYVNSNEDINGDGKKTAFFATDPVAKITIQDPQSGEDKEGYKWVRNVINQIDKGWRAQYKELVGKEPKP